TVRYSTSQLPDPVECPTKPGLPLPTLRSNPRCASASSTASSPTRHANLRGLPLSDMVSWNTVTHWLTSNGYIESSSCAATPILVLCTCTRSRRADRSSHPSLDPIGRWWQGGDPTGSGRQGRWLN